MSRLCPDVVIFPESASDHPERWVVMNVFTRNCLGVGPEVLPALSAPGEQTDSTYRIWRIWRFSNTDGLLADPSRYHRNSAKWGSPELVGHGDLVRILKEQCLLIDDLTIYKERFAPKKTLLDRERFGNYHQQLGQQLIAYERKDPGAWWLQQKFTPDLVEIRKDNLYGAVQDRFLSRWLPTWVRPGLKVLDLGCGAGVISRKIASLGASVHGVDPNSEYIRMAAERAVGDATFEVLNLNAADALNSLPEQSFDVVFMSDALLFYFVPYEPGKPLDLEAFISSLKRILKPGGKFVSLEPHPVFYLLPWLGTPERPFTIITEYLETKWRINPPLARLTKPFLQSGFVITHMDELAAETGDPDIDPRAAGFAAEFPVWLLIEFKTS